MPNNPGDIFIKIDLALSANPGITLFDLAHSLGIDRHSIERSVRIRGGMNFRDFSKRKRLERAVALLEAGDYVKQVAAKLGYRSPDSFARFIKASTGLTPRSIRQKGYSGSMPVAHDPLPFL